MRVELQGVFGFIRGFNETSLFYCYSVCGFIRVLMKLLFLTVRCEEKLFFKAEQSGFGRRKVKS